MSSKLHTHLVQSSEWGEFKFRMGTPAVRVGDIQFTKHKIPGTPFYVGYAPKVNFLNQKFSWTELRVVAKLERCAFIRFDIPNVLNPTSDKSYDAKTIKDIEEHCKKSPRQTFTKWNVLLDIDPAEEQLQTNLTQKTRYNSRLASKKGVEVRLENTDKGLKIFQLLHKETAERQGFLPHPENYYRKAFTVLSSHNMANLLVAYYKGKPIVAWMLFNYNGTIYYPYGGSSAKHRELMASNLMAWEAIKLGKKLNCKLFDMWGATGDKAHPYWGFTKFKLGYGGDLVEYIDSYDFVVDPFMYYLFNFGYNFFWKLRGMMNYSAVNCRVSPRENKKTGRMSL